MLDSAGHMAVAVDAWLAGGWPVDSDAWPLNAVDGDVVLPPVEEKVDKYTRTASRNITPRDGQVKNGHAASANKSRRNTGAETQPKHYTIFDTCEICGTETQDHHTCKECSSKTCDWCCTLADTGCICDTCGSKSFNLGAVASRGGGEQHHYAPDARARLHMEAPRRRTHGHIVGASGVEACGP